MSEIWDEPASNVARIENEIFIMVLAKSIFKSVKLVLVSTIGGVRAYHGRAVKPADK